MRLRQYYDVGYTEATYYLDKQVFYFNFTEENSAIVRVFPLKNYYKVDPDCKMKEIYSAFEWIPDETNDSVTYIKEPTPISIGVKPTKLPEEDAEELLQEEELTMQQSN